MTSLRIFYRISTYIGSSVGLLWNCFMIYVIINTRNVELKKYNMILLQSTIAEILLNIINITICPLILTVPDMVIVPLNPIIHVEKPVFRVLFATWIFFTSVSICATPISFYLRYRILCLNKKFTLKVYGICLVIVGIASLSYSAHSYYSFCLRTQDFLYKAESLAPWFGNENGQVDAIGITGTFDNFLLVNFIHMSAIMGGSYVTVIWCSWRIYRYLARMGNIDSTIMEIQKQLAKTLIIQALIPVLTCCVPGSLIFLTLISPFEFPKSLSGTLGLVMIYTPLSNALCMFFFVKAYRDFGTQLFRSIIRNNIVVTLTVN